MQTCTELGLDRINTLCTWSGSQREQAHGLSSRNDKAPARVVPNYGCGKSRIMGPRREAAGLPAIATSIIEGDGLLLDELGVQTGQLGVAVESYSNSRYR